MTNISTYDVRDVAGWYQEGAGWILFSIWGHIHTALHDAKFCCRALQRLYSVHTVSHGLVELYSSTAL